MIELLVTSALIAIAATVIAGAFAAGFRVWQRASQQGGAYEDAVIALELIQKDVCNTVPFRLIPFKGTESVMEIPAIVPATGGKGPQDQPGSIRYEFSAATRRLDRVRRTIVVPGGEQEFREVVMDNLEAVRFSYGDRGPEGTGPVSWSSVWSAGTNVPACVKVRLQAPPRVDLERILVRP